MNIGVVTFTDGTNYGQRLQNLAVQHIFEEYGHNVETFIIRRPDYGIKNFMKRTMKAAIHPASSFVEYCRQRAFGRFNNEYINFYRKKLYVGIDSTEIENEFDLVVAGSDQVWNPYSAWVSENNFLTFISNSKRASFAASFSIDDIPEDKKLLYKKYLDGIPKITVREIGAQRLIMSLCGKKVDVISDPTIIVGESFWETIMKEPKMSLPENYIVDYVLGSKTETNFIYQFASENNLEVVSLNKNSKWYVTSPADFLYIIKHAKFVFTDSYHGTIFSIIFKKPFRNILRKDANISMQSRFETLYSTLGIHKEFVLSHDNLHETFDYSSISQRIKEERIRSIRIIEKNILEM